MPRLHRRTPIALMLLASVVAGCGPDSASSGGDGDGDGDGDRSGDGDGDGNGDGDGDGDGNGNGDGDGDGNGNGDGDGDGDGDPSPSGDTLSDRYPGDVGLADDPAVLFFDDFEAGWGRWDAPGADTQYLSLLTDGASAHAGSGYLQSSVTRADLDATEYISSQSHINFADPVDVVYLRYYARFVGTAPTPHHWVRMTAGVPGFNGSGRANMVPAGDEGFWFDFDANTDDVFNFYVYWHRMRSGRCNDGSTASGCEGDQGSTYHYGNVFRPPAQAPFPRDAWFCIEMSARANAVGGSDGALAFWVDDQSVGDYRQGHPDGTWLRDSFHTGGCEFSACTAPQPFEGFDFRSSADVQFKGFVLDAYYERGSSANRRATLEDRGIVVSDAQTVLYDDVVIATERVGCRRTDP